MNRILTGLLLLSVISLQLFAQEEDVEDLLNEKIAVENPVYKPVISLGSGVFGFYGDIRNNYFTPTIGNFGYRVMFTTYLDQKRFYKLNLFFLYGSLSANERSVTDLSRNLNFKSDLTDFGITAEYSFDHFIAQNKFIHPFISAGIENIQFTPKSDLLDAEGRPYYYWSDGSIRNVPEAGSDIHAGQILHRNYTYETDLRSHEKNLFNLGAYSTSAFSIPVDIGIDFKISERVSCRLGSSYHFTFTDYMDNVSSEGTSVKGKKGNDHFSYNYFSLHFDLFSEPKTVIVEKLFAELDFDDVMYGDEDGDFILDPVDDCPGTPYGVAVDTTGCPLDTDADGIPDYQDKEPGTASGAWVDDKGRTITEQAYLATLLKREDAMSREDVKAYFNTIGKGYVKKSVTEIPEKFKQLDKDHDGYISFDELLQSIDDYFDYKLDFTVEDIYDLNNFFFEQ
ncbi:MAG TPA: hypothetical protein VE870_14365 [Bacteroidales bacterium]|nr:hypothetical protein [Bacteroidales bacterium]